MNFSRIKGAIKVILGIAEVNPKINNFSKNKFCPVCNKPIGGVRPLSEGYFRKWDKHGFIHSIFLLETLNLFEYSCPICQSSDRERMYALFFKKKINTQEELLLLDIAPSTPLSVFLKSSFPKIKIRTADLLMLGVDDVVDITNMEIYPDCKFDCFICSHVIEHVENDKKALNELFRILKPGGWGILMTPVLERKSKEFIDATALNEDSRWKYYGQGDHLRIYSKNEFVSKILETNFFLEQVSAKDICGEDLDRFGIHPRSVLYIVKKEKK